MTRITQPKLRKPVSMVKVPLSNNFKDYPNEMRSNKPLDEEAKESPVASSSDKSRNILAKMHRLDKLKEKSRREVKTKALNDL
jgi:hypothetical protein